MDDSLDLGTLHAKMDVDNRPYDRGIDAAHKKMDGLGQSTGKTLDEMHGKFSRSGAAMGKDLGDGIGQGVEDGAKRAAEGVDGIYRDASGKLRTARGQFIREGTLLGQGIGDGVSGGAKPGLKRTGADIDAIRDKMKKLDKKLGGTRGRLALLGKVTAFAAIATGAAGAASAIGPVVTLVGSLVVAAGGLAAVLPAALLAAVGAAAALKIGLTGVGDAIAGDEEALERLPGPAREFVGVVRELKPAWDDLTKSVQSKLFEGVAKTFRETAGTILPRLKTGLGQVADGWNDVFRAGLKAATTPRFLAGLDAVLKRTGAGLTSFAKGLDGWFRGIGVLLMATAPLLEDMGDYAGRLGDRFGAWMEQARASGALQSTLQTMLDTLRFLFGIVGNLGSIFGSVFGAAAEQGGGLLGILDDLTGDLAAFLKSAEGQDQLADFFARLRDVGDAVSPIILAIVGAVASLAPKIADIAEGLGPSLADLFERIGDAIGKIDAEALADGFADVLDAVIPLIDPIGSLLGGISEIDGIVPVVAISLGIFTVAVWALNAALYANPIVWIIALIIALIAVIVLAILNWDKIVAVFKLSWIMVVAAFEDAKSAISLIMTAIGDFFADRVDQAKLVFAWFGTLPGRFADWIGGVKDASVAKFTLFIDWVKGLPDRILGALGDLGSLLTNAGKEILQGLLDGVDSMWSSVESKFASLTAMIPNWKGPASVDRDLLKGPAGLIMGGFAEHLESLFPMVRGVLSDLTSEIGLNVDGSAAPTTMAAPTVIVQAAAPETYTATIPIDLGDGIQQVVEVELRRSNRDLKRSVGAGVGSAM